MSWEDEDNTRGFLKKRHGWRLSRRRVWVALACVVCVFCVAKHCWDCQAKPNNKARETVRAANPLAPDAPDMTQFASVGEWLQSLKMGRYAEGFERGGITTMDAVVQLTVKELTALGVTLVGHQKKIMNSVQAMRAQISANLSEGFLV